MKEIYKKSARYGVGFVGQGASYVMMGTYLVLFLTNCVGLSSVAAATISSLALFAEVIAGVLIGNISDGFRSRWGRRRPFMFLAGAAMLPILMLATNRIGSESTSPVVLFAYYLVFAALFRLFFSTFEIPNQALGAELVRGYDERTWLRTIQRLFSICGNGLGYIVPLLFFSVYGNDSPKGWRIIGLTFGLITAASMISSAILNKAGDPDNRALPVHEAAEEAPSGTPKKRGHIMEIIYNYSELMKIKPVRLMVLYKSCFTCGYGLYNVCTVYYLTYAAGFPSIVSAHLYYINVTIFLVMIPIVNRMAIKMGKANQLLVTMFLCGAVGVGVYFLAPATMVGTILYIATFSMMQTSFWQLSYALFNDVVEVDEWVYGKRRAGDVSSIISVLGTLFSAIAIEFFGLTFDRTGFDPDLAVQSAGTVHFLNVMFILIPAIFFLIATVILKVFPINKKTFESLTSALEARRKGESYEEYMPDVNKILGKR